MFKNKTLLITGGTGSFGTAVLKRYLDSDIGEIRIFSRDEKKQDDRRKTFENNEKIKYYVGDVRDYESISHALNNVDFVFHAAALKQVPSCDFYPLEAVKTNIIGANNVIHAAIANKVRKIILLSTDKAVYPINAMGMTKAIMEKLMVAESRNLSDNDILLCATRYGNVMGSRGSVIPLFLKLIQEGKKITVTDPKMTRFMMHMDEAVGLVLYAFMNAHQGDLFIKKAPACTIGNLAIGMKELLGASNEIEIIGTRHGEKLYETLVNREEMTRVEDLGGYFRIPPDTRDLNYKKFFEKGEEKISKAEDYTSHNTKQLNIKEIKELLKTLPCIQKALCQK